MKTVLILFVIVAYSLIILWGQIDKDIIIKAIPIDKRPIELKYSVNRFDGQIISEHISSQGFIERKLSGTFINCELKSPLSSARLELWRNDGPLLFIQYANKSSLNINYSFISKVPFTAYLLPSPITSFLFISYRIFSNMYKEDHITLNLLK